MFFSVTRKPRPYYIIDTGKGKLANITPRTRYANTYTVYFNYIEAPNMMVSKRLPLMEIGLDFSPFRKFGYKEVGIPGLSENYLVFCKEASAAYNFLKDIASNWNNILGDFCFEISSNAFICYRYNRRPKLKELDDYLYECEKIRDVLKRN